MVSDFSGLKVFIKGTVQGVGFRPFIYRLAIDNHLTGWVNNTSAGVEIEINGTNENIATFLSALSASPPPLAKIEAINSVTMSPKGFSTFEIVESKRIAGEFLPVPAESSVCSDCLRELFDSSDRRFRYPFINCTNCGPRYTIIKDIPYDRRNTTMAEFNLCPECQKEFDNPLDRRYHAQPVACPVCGPQIWTEIDGGKVFNDPAISIIRTLTSEGKISAIKGLGGFHLACDAMNDQAVRRLRKRKRRFDKPFAVMVFNDDIANTLFEVSEQENKLLNSLQRPIVLLKPKRGNPLAYSLTQGLDRCGVMLPYTPLHYLLLEPEKDIPLVWVMTSGNVSDEPIAHTNEDAMKMLSNIADAFLLHNRGIHTRIDDSVVFHATTINHFIRRARGYAPEAVRLPFDVNGIFAAGALIKNTFCIGRDDYAFMSPHIGDLENEETFDAYKLAFEQYQNLFSLEVRSVSADLHPEYRSTQFAQQIAYERNIPILPVQHHHAHLAACMADNGIRNDTNCIGVCLDGTGLGTDGTIWGGEFLYGGYTQYERILSLQAMPLPGGDAAVHHPARIALSYLMSCGISWDQIDLPPLKAFSQQELNIFRWGLEQSINITNTSSMGRLFDAVSSIIGIRQHSSFEGQAAMLLESAADLSYRGEYPVVIENSKILIRPILEELMQDMSQKKSRTSISSKFHRTISNMVALGCKQIRQNTGASLVALSGGVWQNRILLALTVPELKSAGFTVLLHKNVPANDGGLSLGQLAIAACQTN